MYIDASAIVAIILEEPESDNFVARIYAADRPVTSVISEFEAALSVGRRVDGYLFGLKFVRGTLENLGIEVLGVPADFSEAAAQAYSRYGKGTGHPAQLNFGDCFSYAFAKIRGIPLLYKGNDFSQTDLAVQI